MLNLKPLRDWFGFTRRERRASFILLIIVVVILAIRFLFPVKNMEIEDITATILNSEETVVSDSVVSFLSNSDQVSHDTLKRINEKDVRPFSGNRNTKARFRQRPDTPGDLNKKSFRNPKALIDLNNCDTAMLATLPGIGPVLSSRIVKYRNLLGGYASVDQLGEVYGLPTETFDLIKNRLFADSTFVKKINLNSTDYKRLSRMPYLETYDVMSILKYRQLTGSIKSITELVDNKIITSEKALKIRPYIVFE